MTRTLAAALLLALACAAFSAPGYIDSRRIAPVRDGDAAAGKEKATACVACHGENGISPTPIFPNLRSQSVEYLYSMLVEFKRGTRETSPMTPLVAPLSDREMRDLAAFYAEAGRRPAPAAPAAPVESAADSASLTRGRQLYMQGDGARGIPPCQGCHGAEAEGHPLLAQSGAATDALYRTYPALRAQKRDYLVTRLKEYREGKLAVTTNAFIMVGVTRHLDDDSIDAVAAWLSAMPIDDSPGGG